MVENTIASPMIPPSALKPSRAIMAFTGAGGKKQATDPASNDDHVKSHVRSMGRVVLTLHAPLLNRFSIGCLDGVEPEANFLLKMFRSDWGWACGRARAGIRDRRCGREFAAGLASAPEGVQARAALGSCGLPTRGSETYRGSRFASAAWRALETCAGVAHRTNRAR